MRAIGIDLGTTNSAAAIGGKEVKVLPNRDNQALTPSVISLVKRRNSPQPEIVVGQQAVNNAARDPVNTVFSVKRLMGLVYGEERVEEVKTRIGYRIADPPAETVEDQGVRVLVGDQALTPTEISGKILGQIRADAELALGETVTHAVITVPAYFTEKQRDATKRAGAMAGLEVLSIIDEPSAAAIAFGASREDERHRVLVFDLGGGTFDISIIQMRGGKFQVLEINGDKWLGGDDFDQVIVQLIVDWVRDSYSLDPADDKAFLAKAKEHAQRAKIALSVQQSTEINIPLMHTFPGGKQIDLEMEVTREQFERGISPLVDRSVDLVYASLKSQHFSPDDISELLLVGGSTAIPLVQQRVIEIFGREKVKRHVNPMECVALGAAIQAARFELSDDGRVDTAKADESVVAVAAVHLGIAALKGNNPDTFVPIIEKGTPYPLTAPKKQLFFPTEENQRVIRVPVYEGLNELASLNELQGELEFPLADGIGSNTAVEVSFNFDRNRILTVTVRVVGGDHKPFVEELRRDRARNKANDKRKDELMDDWRDDLQPSLRAAKHFLERYEVYMDAADASELKEACIDGEKALNNDDETAGRLCSKQLQNKILSSGTASQLFIAERVMDGAPSEYAQSLATAVAELREAYKKGRTDAVRRISEMMRVTVARVIDERSERRSIGDREDLRGLLRVRP